MNPSAEESLMALLEAMLTLAAGGEARRQPAKPLVNAGGYPEEQFLDLTEEEKTELSCSICYQILKETMQCVNNHKFCHSCLVVWSTTGQYANRVRCPVCRTSGYYFRNDEMDDRVGAKKVKCHLESCTWTGLAKYMNSHRHNTYGNDDAQSESDAKSSGATSSIPRLTQVAPRVPPSSTARFVGTGLTTRGATESSNQGSSASGHVPLLGARAASRASTSSLSSTSQETVVEINILRPSGGTGTSSNTASSNAAATRRVPPVRAPAQNRITFAHTRASRDANNNIGVTQTTNTSTPQASLSSVSDSSEGIPNSVTGGLTPRPPSAPRPNAVNTRRLPRIINPPPQRNPDQQSSALSQTQRSGISFERNQGPAASLSDIRDHLQDSRSRLNNLMSSFSGELDRSRQEMMEFQQQRERQRREQLEEVRELGQRLGQVAFELRRLLEHRRRLPNFSDSDEDSDA